MVSVRDVVRRTQRQASDGLGVDLPAGVDDVVGDVADEFLSALPEDIRMAIREAVDQTDNSLQDIIQDAEAAGQPITEYVRDQFDTFLPDEEETPPEEDEEDDEGTSIADLVGEAEPEVFDRTFLVEKEDAPASTGDPWPIPQPWQGLPRLAFTVNLNYVYDEANEEWVRQGPFDGGAGVIEVVETNTVPVPQSGTELVDTALSGGDRQLLLTFAFPTPSQLDDGTFASPIVNSVTQEQETNTNDADVSVVGHLQYKVSDDLWRVRLRATSFVSDPVDVEYKILEVTT